MNLPNIYVELIQKYFVNKEPTRFFVEFLQKNIWQEFIMIIFNESNRDYYYYLLFLSFLLNICWIVNVGTLLCKNVFIFSASFSLKMCVKMFRISNRLAKLTPHNLPLYNAKRFRVKALFRLIKTDVNV